LDDIENNEDGGLDKFTRSYERFGMKVQPDGSVVCHEWCPGAQALFLRGDFSQSFIRSFQLIFTFLAPSLTSFGLHKIYIRLFTTQVVQMK